MVSFVLSPAEWAQPAELVSKVRQTATNTAEGSALPPLSTTRSSSTPLLPALRSPTYHDASTYPPAPEETQGRKCVRKGSRRRRHSLTHLGRRGWRQEGAEGPGTTKTVESPARPEAGERVEGTCGNLRLVSKGRTGGQPFPDALRLRRLFAARSPAAPPAPRPPANPSEADAGQSAPGARPLRRG